MPGPMTQVGRRGVLAAALGTPLLAACAGGAPDVSGRLRIATGNTGAVFDRYGSALAAEVARTLPGVAARTVPTDGSRANLATLADGRAEVAFCLGDNASEAVDATSAGQAVPFAAVARLYDSFLQVVTRAGSGIREVGDLAGRRLSAGQQESGTRVTLARALEAADVRDAELVTASLAESVEGLRSGDLDALAFVSGYPVPALVDLGRELPLRGLDLSSLVPRLVRRWGPQYVAGPLPAGAYRLPQPVGTVSVKTYLVCRPDLDEALVEGVLDVVFDRQRAVARRVPDVRQPTVAAGMFTAPVPLHPASLRWFRELDRRET